MCGISGLFAYRAAAEQPKEVELLAMRDAMRRRGPDGAGAWWSGGARCGLGHRRLSIIDLSDRAMQPMASCDGRHVVVFNGEIYNLPILRAELEREGVHFRTASDTEALLHLYARDGERMVYSLRGMYAFAIWDDVKQGLFLARDPFGIKPLYTADDGFTFRFASQVKALLAGCRVSRDPDPAGAAGFYLFGSVPEPFTLYREIHALPAGHWQWVDAAGARSPECFQKLTDVLADGARQSALAPEYEERIRAAALDSVTAHLLADVEVGLFLSAGVDSGALLGLMRDAGQQKIRAITLGFDEFAGTAEDEVPLAREIASFYDAQHVVRRVSAREFREDLPLILDAMDQPSIDGINTWFVSKAAREAGLKVALSGLGGDEMLGGYSSFEDIPRWRRVYGPFSGMPLVGRFARASAIRLAPMLLERRPKAAGMLEYSGSWPGAYLLRRGLFLPHELPGILGDEIAHEGLSRLQPLARIGEGLNPDPGSDYGRVCALECANYMRNQLLRDADWAGMSHSIEIRVPLVDWELLKAIAPILPTIRKGEGKSALANSPSRTLPPSIVNRAKTGFAVPTKSWLEQTLASRWSAPAVPKGIISRKWAGFVMNAAVSQQLDGLT